MAVARDDLRRAARKRGIEGQVTIIRHFGIRCIRLLSPLSTAAKVGRGRGGGEVYRGGLIVPCSVFDKYHLPVHLLPSQSLLFCRFLPHPQAHFLPLGPGELSKRV